MHESVKRSGQLGGYQRIWYRQLNTRLDVVLRTKTNVDGLVHGLVPDPLRLAIDVEDYGGRRSHLGDNAQHRVFKIQKTADPP
jgi:hypothetical protein